MKAVGTRTAKAAERALATVLTHAKGAYAHTKAVAHDWESLISLWSQHAETEFWHRWARCQIAAAVVTRYGTAALEKFGAEVRTPTGTLYKMREVYQNEPLRKYVESFSPKESNPFNQLTYSHLVAVRGLADPVKRLEHALDHEHSARAMERGLTKRRLSLTLKVKHGYEGKVQKIVAELELKGWVDVVAR